ncbi:hypothetical protein CWI80_02085 [Pseudidiomarina sediminum]|uniref:Lipoprotein n=1 Tax=Pseudidiomarina sediminum TaxID=431675 RepID=A0A432Z8F1_9GAMM|nr:hypothetical protein [Pseudidiomarina sediminum]MBY6063318.1 hypothetical protein [Pseudidiomarina sediminum]RUO74166.1 hypothetical protein CWI80_02085 [Pseudidiomarina sediminum]
MKRSLLTLTVSLALISCASVDYTKIDNRIPANVILTQGDHKNIKYIDSINYRHNIEYSPSLSAKCLILHVDNHGITLKDSSNTFVGPYTGRLYSIDSSTDIQGDSVLLFNDEHATIGQGLVKGSFVFGIATIEKIYRFKLILEPIDGQTVLSYSNIQAAQVDTGYSPNSGFVKVGAWPEAQPMLLVNLINAKTEALKKCLSSSE